MVIIKPKINRLWDKMDFPVPKNVRSKIHRYLPNLWQNVKRF